MNRDANSSAPTARMPLRRAAMTWRSRASGGRAEGGGAPAHRTETPLTITRAGLTLGRPMPHRRNPYADRLSEFGEFAFADEGVFAHRGKWNEFFGGRMGRAF